MAKYTKTTNTQKTDFGRMIAKINEHAEEFRTLPLKELKERLPEENTLKAKALALVLKEKKMSGEKEA